MERQYKNLGYFLFILVAFVELGFYKPYFSLIPHLDPSISPPVQVDAILLALPLLLLSHAAFALIARPVLPL